MIVGLVRPTAGKVFFRERDVTRMAMYRRARMGMGYLAQEPSIFRKLTVRENVQAVLETLPISRKERKNRLEKLLAELHIDHLSDQRAFTLSGGERRRLEITRALATEPSVLLLDEPFSGVDPLAVNEVQDIICSLRDQGLGILITDHNVRETLKLVDRAYIIHQGQVLCEGNAEFLAEDPKAREVYLGPEFNL